MPEPIVVKAVIAIDQKGLRINTLMTKSNQQALFMEKWVDKQAAGHDWTPCETWI